jgi:hypothetical protein
MTDIPLEVGRGVTQVNYGADINAFNQNQGGALDNQAKATDNQGRQLDLQSKNIAVGDQQAQADALRTAGNPQIAGAVAHAVAGLSADQQQIHVDAANEALPALTDLQAKVSKPGYVPSADDKAQWDATITAIEAKFPENKAHFEALRKMGPTPDAVNEATTAAGAIVQYGQKAGITPAEQAAGARADAKEKAVSGREAVKGGAAIVAGNNYVHLDGTPVDQQAEGAAIYRYTSGAAPQDGDAEILQNVKDAKSTDNKPLQGTAPPTDPNAQPAGPSFLEKGRRAIGDIATGNLGDITSGKFNGSSTSSGLFSNGGAAPAQPVGQLGVATAPAPQPTGQLGAAPAAAPVPAPVAAPAPATARPAPMTAKLTAPTPVAAALAAKAARPPSVIPPGYEQAKTPKNQAEYDALPKGTKYFMVKQDGTTVPSVKQ